MFSKIDKVDAFYLGIFAISLLLLYFSLIIS